MYISWNQHTYDANTLFFGTNNVMQKPRFLHQQCDAKTLVFAPCFCTKWCKYRCKLHHFLHHFLHHKWFKNPCGAKTLSPGGVLGIGAVFLDRLMGRVSLSANRLTTSDTFLRQWRDTIPPNGFASHLFLSRVISPPFTEYPSRFVAAGQRHTQAE